MVDLGSPPAELTPSYGDVGRGLLVSVAETAPIGIFLAGAEGRIVFANRAFEKMLGYDVGECIGLGVNEVVSSADASNVREQFGRLIAGEGEGYQSERRYVHKTGRLVRVVASASLIQEPRAAKTAYAAVYVTDIDRQRRAEKELASIALRSDYALESSGQGVWEVDSVRDTTFHSRN